MTPRQTSLGKLLRDSRKAAGLSRLRTGELIGISPYTIEGWELGRVAKPPIHDVLRLTHFLNIPAEEIERAVFEDAGLSAESRQPAQTAKPPRRKANSEGAVPLLEAAFGLIRWKDDSQAADALGTTPDQVRRWRTGIDAMELGDYMTLTSIIGIAAAAAIKGDKNSAADLDAAARTLGLRPGRTNQR